MVPSLGRVMSYLFDAVQQLFLAVRAVYGLSGQDDVIASQNTFAMQELWEHSPVTCMAKISTSIETQNICSFCHSSLSAGYLAGQARQHYGHMHAQDS